MYMHEVRARGDNDQQWMSSYTLLKLLLLMLTGILIPIGCSVKCINPCLENGKADSFIV